MNQGVRGVLTPERSIKDQYAKLFERSDWSVFKKSADYYMETAAKILTEDITYGEDYLKLLRRNVQKRLFVGIACELLLKAFYLKNGYCINKLKQGSTIKGKYPFKIEQIIKEEFKDDDTLSFKQLIDKMYTINDFGDKKDVIDKGLRIAKVFRNKEGHVVVLWHDYDPQNYRDIEASLIAFYKKTFSENLSLRFSVGDGEKALFNITNIG